MSPDNKHDDREENAGHEFDDGGDEGYSMGGDESDPSVMEAEEVFEDPHEESYDDSGDEGGGEAFEEEKAGSNKNMKKMMAPALVLVCAAGIGAYILMNPGLIGGGKAPTPSPVQQQVASVAPPPAPDVQQPMPVPVPVPEMPAADMPPQPAPLQQVQETEAVPPPRDAFGENPPVSGVDSAAAQMPVPSSPDVAPPVPAPAAEAIGAPPAPSADVEIAGIPAKQETAPLPEKMETPPAQAPETQPAAEQKVPAAPTEPVFPAAPEPAAANAAQPVPSDAPPPAENFPSVTAAAPGAALTAAHVPGLEGGGAEAGVVGKGATAQDVKTPPTPLPEKQEEKPESDTYFDSALTVPTSPAAKDTGPRKVDPVLEPGSSFVVVTKTHSEQSQESLMVSANRALKLGRYEAAIEMYDSLYKRNPRDPAVLYGRAVAYQKAGRADAALKIYDELLAVDKDNGAALVNMLGLLRQQYPEVALRRLKNLHDQYPGNAGITAQIGLSEADLGHYDDALRYLGMAASAEPNNALHLFNMAVVCDRKGDKAQAIKYYEQALEADAVYGGHSVPRERIYDRLSVLRRG